MTERSCRVCGCTQNNACLTPDGPCHWVEPDLCSGCAPWGIANQIKDAMVKKVSQAISNGETVRLHCGGETLGYFTPQGFVGPSHPMFDRFRPADLPPKSDDPTLEPPKVG